MLLDILFKKSEVISKNNKKIKTLLLFIALYFFPFKRSKDILYTEEALCDKMNLLDDVCSEDISFKDDHGENTFSLNNRSPNATILIHGKKSDMGLFRILISSIKKSRVVTKNLKVVLTDDGEYKADNVQYFCIIKLSFSGCCCTKLFPFQSQQPNSDLLLISKKHFPAKTCYRPHLINRHPNNVNRLEISISTSKKDIADFLLFNRSLQNLHSYSLGTYFYVPFPTFSVNLISLLPFVGVNIFYSVFSSLHSRQIRFETQLIYALAYVYVPAFSVFFINRNHLTNACCILFFMFVNFKYGVLYTVLVFVKNVFYSVIKDRDSKLDI